jgi:hypothetical protein
MPSESVPTLENTVLRYTFSNTRPVELNDLTSSLTAMGDQYQSYLRRSGEEQLENDFRLYVRDVRTGSLIFDLVTLATQHPMFSVAAPLLMQYATDLNDWFDYFKGLKQAAEIDEMLAAATKRDLQQLSDLIEPAAKDAGSTITINAAQGSVVMINSMITSTQANAGQNVLRRHIEHIPAPTTGIHHDQVLYWYQVRHDHAAKPGDKAVIERIWKSPVKVRITSDEIKRKMLDGEGNPFRKYYVVDVDVTDVQGRPVLYRILDVKDSFDRDENAA